MSEQTGQSCEGTEPRTRRELGRLTLLGCVLSLFASARCTFPDYDVTLPAAAGTAAGVASSGGVLGSAGSSGGAGTTSGGAGGAGGGSGGAQSGSTASSGQGGTDVAAPGSGGEAGEASVGGEGPTCPGEQWPVEHCAAGCLTRYPDHCYDGDQSGDETAPDCGGSCQGCSYEACAEHGDCLSGNCETITDGGSACHAPLMVSLTPQGVSRYVGSTNWKLNVRNAEPADGQDFALKDLKLRYYLARSGIVDPLLVQSTQSSLMLAAGGSRMLPLTSWSIERVEPLTDAQYDAYIEISFGDSVRLMPGDGVELFQQLSTGWSSSSNFDQFANYSFKDKADTEFVHVTLFYRDALVWGLEPRPANPRACFARAVNLNGDAVSIAGHAWQAAAAANLTTTGSQVTQSSALYPTASGDTATMLASSTRLGTGQNLELPVTDGTYLVYLHATSASSDGSASLFSLQGAEPESSAGFRAQFVSNAGAWSKLGPFRVNVTTGKLSLAVTKGAMNFAGLELWYPD